MIKVAARWLLLVALHGAQIVSKLAKCFYVLAYRKLGYLLCMARSALPGIAVAPASFVASSGNTRTTTRGRTERCEFALVSP